jgi:hypothetical protein
MVRLVSKWKDEANDIFGMLGRMLLQISDDSNAQVAFRGELMWRDGVVVYAVVVCDQCGCAATQKTGRAICWQCSDRDLCDQCHSADQTGNDDMATCKDHGFVVVALEDDIRSNENVVMQKIEIEAWLQNLSVLYSKTGERSD